MNRTAFRICLASWFLLGSAAYSAPISGLKFTDVIKDVTVIDPATKAESPAKVGDVLAPASVLKTGPDSRAELVAEDQTVTRVGANTIFSVDAASRDVNVGQGSVLFHSPPGRGGGRIKSAGATASVLGTTLIVGANPSGGFKVMLLEGKGSVASPTGKPVSLLAGQMSFALPGKPASQPLNFELKGQVGASKLVGGFSKPLASLAKIEAAISVQQAKIASGQLANTGLLIGDRPDTAFKVEAVQDIVKVVVDQVKATTQTTTASRSSLDPRYLLAIQRSLSLTDGIAAADYVFQLDGGGTSTDGYSITRTVPGNQNQGAVAALIANNISIAPSQISNSVAAAFLLAPFLEEKDSGAIVALNTLSITGNTEFVDSTALNEDVIVDKPLLLSAGYSFVVSSGSLVKANTSIWDIFVSGAPFSTGQELAEQASASPQPLTLERVALVNDFAESAGMIRIKAPSISLLSTAVEAHEVQLQSTRGDVTVGSSANTSTSNLPLGFTSTQDLALRSYILGINSAAGISLSNVHIYANTVTLNASSTMSMSGIVVSSTHTLRDQAITATSAGNLTVQNSRFASMISLALQSTAGGVSISGTDIGSFYTNTAAMDSATPVKTSLSVIAALDAVLNYTSPTNLYADVTTISGRDITVSNVVVTPTDSPNGSFAATATRDITVTNTIVTASQLTFDAVGNLTITNSSFPSAGSQNTFTARSRATDIAKQVSLDNVNLSNAQTVTVDGSTVKLKDVTFKDGSNVTLKSQTAMVAANPGQRTTVAPGYVNIMSGVRYGSTLINFSSEDQHMDQAAFRGAAQTALGNNLSNITIGQH